MENWQIFVSLCAGFLVIINLADKIGLTNKVKKVDADYKELKKLLDNFTSLSTSVEVLTGLQEKQNQALLALLRNDLYRCFKDNRDIAAWTDDDCRVQTKLHEAYRALNGNGEESIWWDRKVTWKIVSEEELRTLIAEKRKH